MLRRLLNTGSHIYRIANNCEFAPMLVSYDTAINLSSVDTQANVELVRIERIDVPLRDESENITRAVQPSPRVVGRWIGHSKQDHGPVTDKFIYYTAVFLGGLLNNPSKG